MGNAFGGESEPTPDPPWGTAEVSAREPLLDERPVAAFPVVAAAVAAFSLLVLHDRAFGAAASGVAAGVGCVIGMRLRE